MTKTWRRGNWWLVLRDYRYWTGLKVQRTSETFRFSQWMYDYSGDYVRKARPRSIWQFGPIAVIHTFPEAAAT